ncbi:MAG: hypothetical protein QNK23_05895 [Crocinitomicaceae bacterium]|nr:hypothetical protein [Crocinitomicaceae bacterium]
MKQLFILLLIANISWAERGEGWNYPISLEKSEVDSSLTNEESIFRFRVANITDANENRVIIYKIDGRKKKAKLIDNEYFDVHTVPGKHVFQFFYKRCYVKVYSDSLLIKGGYKDEYFVRFDEVNSQDAVTKPVIYLYPPEDTHISVKVDIEGDNPFFYPSYPGKWEFIATPDGELNFDNATYNYLFWEADQFFRLTAEEYQTGFICKGENAVAFLEEKLTLAGLTSEEKADFITFWVPRLQRNELNYVHFMFNDECNVFAQLSITPQPDHVYRLYMIWSPIEGEFVVEEQTIPLMNRSGFSVLEWGGIEQPIIEDIEIN